MEISKNTKLEIAVEVMASKIASTLQAGYSTDSKEIQALMKEREEMYKGNENVIEKIIRDYRVEKNA